MSNIKNDDFDKFVEQTKQGGEFVKKYSLIPSYIIGGLSIISLIIISIVIGDVILPYWLVFMYIGIMFLMPLSVIYPGLKWAYKLWDKKLNKDKIK